MTGKERRQQLLDVGRHLFAERGLDGATMSDVAAATGIPRATLYYHFASKEEVFSYMCGTVLDALYQAVAEALQSNGNAATAQRIRTGNGTDWLL